MQSVKGPFGMGVNTHAEYAGCKPFDYAKEFRIMHRKKLKKMPIDENRKLLVIRRMYTFGKSPSSNIPYYCERTADERFPDDAWIKSIEDNCRAAYTMSRYEHALDLLGKLEKWMKKSEQRECLRYHERTSENKIKSKGLRLLS